MFDSPPILGRADALLISEAVDGLLLLIGLGSVDRSLPREVINKIKSLGLNFYGIVTNQTKKESRGFDRKYGYGKYGKKYGLQYGMCLETQNFPDAINNQNFPSPILKKGKIYKSFTKIKLRNDFIRN